jgi:hypothetical protein
MCIWRAPYIHQYLSLTRGGILYLILKSRTLGGIIRSRHKNQCFLDMKISSSPEVIIMTYFLECYNICIFKKIIY